MAMDEYVLPREAFALLEEALGERQKAEVLARAIEVAIGAIETRAEELITAEYVLPREAFALLEEAVGERQKAEVFARAIEAAIQAI